MKRNALAMRISALVVVLGCCLVVAGCALDSGTTTTTIPEGWSTFEGGSVLLALPDTFTGGVPSDPEVAALMAEVSEATGTAMLGDQYDLVAVGEPNEAGDYPTVGAVLESGLAGSSPSMEEIVNSMMGGIEATGFTVLDLVSIGSAEERAEYVITVGQAETEDVAFLMRVVILKGESWLCMVTYSYDDPENTSLDEVFDQSAETITVDAE